VEENALDDGRPILSYQSASKPSRRRGRLLAATTVAAMLLFTLTCWFCQLHPFARRLFTPAFQGAAFGDTFNIITAPTGVQFLFVNNEPDDVPTGFRLLWSETYPTYEDGFHFDILGIVACVVTSRVFHDGYSTTPQAALVLPYWLLLAALAVLLLKLVGLWGAVSPYRRWSHRSLIAGSVLAGLFLAAQFIPFAMSEAPDETYTRYGMPFCFLMRFPGYDPDWIPHKLGENLTLLLLLLIVTRLLLDGGSQVKKKVEAVR
jgi:hypothetical protein